MEFTMRMFIATLLILASSLPGHSETCDEKFVRLFTDRTEKGPVKIHVTQEIKGGMTSKNYNYQSGTGNWMTEMIEPADMQWSLVYENVMYASSDKGKSWKRIRELDSAHDPEKVRKDLQVAADTASNFACGTGELNGVKHETVEADYEYAKYKSSHHDKYWVNPQTGWISKSLTLTKQAGFESATTQLIEPAPGLKFPVPE